MPPEKITIETLPQHWPWISGIVGAVGSAGLALVAKINGKASRDELTTALNRVHDRLDGVLLHAEEQRRLFREEVKELINQRSQQPNKRRDDPVE